MANAKKNAACDCGSCANCIRYGRAIMTVCILQNTIESMCEIVESFLHNPHDKEDREALAEYVERYSGMRSVEDTISEELARHHEQQRELSQYLSSARALRKRTA